MYNVFLVMGDAYSYIKNVSECFIKRIVKKKKNPKLHLFLCHWPISVPPKNIRRPEVS